MTHRPARLLLALSVILIVTLSCKAVQVQSLIDRRSGVQTPTLSTTAVSIALQKAYESWTAPRKLPENCLPSASGVEVEAGEEPAGKEPMLQGCVVEAGSTRPRLAVINPNSFYIEIQPAQATWDYPPRRLLKPGERITFTAAVHDPSPLVVQAETNPLAQFHNLTDLLISLLPGEALLGGQSDLVDCIAAKEQDAPDLLIAAQALAGGDPTSAAGALVRLLHDPGLSGRWIETAKACGYTPAQSWTVETFRQTGEQLKNERALLEKTLGALVAPREAELRFSWQRAAADTPPAAAQPVETAPSSPTLNAAPDGASQITRVGLGSPYYLRFDPRAWKASLSAAPDGAQAASLSHQKLTGCTLSDSLGHGAPENWTVESEKRSIGAQQYSIETWTNIDTGQVALLIYALNDQVHIALQTGAQPAACIQAAEQILAQSGGEILSGPKR